MVLLWWFAETFRCINCVFIVCSGARHALLAQTQRRKVSGGSAQLHPVSWRVDGGGPSSVWTGLQFPWEELPPHPADGTSPFIPSKPVRTKHHNQIKPVRPVSLMSCCVSALSQLPDKTMASLVRFYYSWKKSRSKTSLMDRQTRKNKRERDDRWADTCTGNTPGNMTPAQVTHQVTWHLHR